MFKLFFVNRSFFGFVAGLIAGLLVILMGDNVLMAFHPELQFPQDQRLIPEWTENFKSLSFLWFLSLAFLWQFAIVLAAWLATYMARGTAIIGLGAGFGIWVYSFADSLQRPFPWWVSLLVFLWLLIAPLLGMMIGRYPFRKAQKE